MATPPRNTKNARRVSFDNIEIVELSMTLGDHPFCSEGPPVQVSNEVQSRTTVHVDDYEHRRSPRRDPDDLYLSSMERRIM